METSTERLARADRTRLGTVYRLDGSGSVTVLHAFGNGYDGSTPNAGVVQGGDGALYGTATQGPGYGNFATGGIVFRLSLGTVNQAPAITSANATTFTVGGAGTFAVTTSGSPTVSTITQTGTLPTGVTFTDSGNGTATLSGTPASATGGSYPLTITASNRVLPNATQLFTLTVNTPVVNQAPAVTSASAASFTVGSAGTFIVTTTGTPTVATVTQTGALPTGVTFTDNGNGTATLSGTPAPATGGSYSFTITASNGVAPDATQSFTLTVNQPPAITSAAAATFTVGNAGTFTVTTSGFPPVGTITETGALPAGVTFTNNGNGTATLSGTPLNGMAGSYPLTITALNIVPAEAKLSFTLTVSETPADVWLTAAPMNSARFRHTATLLPDGRVLVAGGQGSDTILASAEIYDPLSNSWAIVPSMNMARERHTATLLPDGRVLVAGGLSSGTILASAEIYDPLTNSWAIVPPMNRTRYLHTATLLLDGRVLVVGGLGSGTVGEEIYDPLTNHWTTVPDSGGHAEHTATLLKDGRVLVAGGASNPFPAKADVYDPLTNSWAIVPSMNVARRNPTATLLPDGRVLVAGGLTGTASSYLASSEIYDQLTNSWAIGPPMSAARYLDTATLLPDGRVLAAGGWGGSGAQSSAEIYDLLRSSWTSAPPMSEARYAYTATLLPDGRVWVAGGSGNSGVLASTETFSTAQSLAPVITSVNVAAFTVWNVGTFTVTTTATPRVSTITEAGALPTGVTFTDNGNGTATLSGTPAATTGGSYPLTITASNGVLPDATQLFTLTVNTPVVNHAPAVTSASAASFTVGSTGTFIVTTTGTPTVATVTKNGVLPTGVTFTDNGNGTATLSGTPAAATGGSYPVTITATNGVTPDATQFFTLTVNRASQTITVTQAAPATAVFSATFPVSATASSGLPVAIGASGACSVIGGTVTMTSGTGICQVTFDQAGDASYAAALQVVQPTTAQRATPTVSVTGGTFVVDGAPHGAATGFAYGVGGIADILSPAVTFSYDGTGSTTYGPTPTPPTATGTYSATAIFAGNINYTGASSSALLAITTGATYVVVDTGPGGTTEGYQLGFTSDSFGNTYSQNFAGQFTLSDMTTLDSVQGWMDGLGSLAVVIRTDQGGLPGTVLFSKTYRRALDHEELGHLLRLHDRSSGGNVLVVVRRRRPRPRRISRGYVCGRSEPARELCRRIQRHCRSQPAPGTVGKPRVRTRHEDFGRADQRGQSAARHHERDCHDVCRGERRHVHYHDERISNGQHDHAGRCAAGRRHLHRPRQRHGDAERHARCGVERVVPAHHHGQQRCAPGCDPGLHADRQPGTRHHEREWDDVHGEHRRHVHGHDERISNSQHDHEDRCAADRRHLHRQRQRHGDAEQRASRSDGRVVSADDHGEQRCASERDTILHADRQPSSHK